MELKFNNVVKTFSLEVNQKWGGKEFEEHGDTYKLQDGSS